MCCVVLQSCPTLCYPMDHNLSGSSVYRILQPIILEWVVVPSSRGSSQPRISPTHISYVFLLCLAELMPPGKPSKRYISSVWFSSVAQSCPILCNPMNRSTRGLPVHHQLPEFTQTHVLWVSDAIQPSHLLSSSSPPAPNPSQHQGLSNESTLCMRWPKYWSFSFSISPSNEYPGLTPVNTPLDWLDLLVVQGTLKSLLQYHSSKASILRRSAFFTVQLSHPYMTTGKTIALTRWTFVDKVMSLLLNMPSRLVITFLPKSKHLLISWLQSPSVVILEPKIIKSDTVSTVTHLFPMKWWDQMLWS